MSDDQYPRWKMTDEEIVAGLRRIRERVLSHDDGFGVEVLDRAIKRILSSTDPSKARPE